VKIWSLLPSSTEILFALGLGDQVTGVTHGCDTPPEAASKQRVTFSEIDSALSSAEIDSQVAELGRSGQQLYHIVEQKLKEDPPDLIITQDLCPVCAVSPSDFAGHMEAAGCSAEVVCLNPHLLEGVIEDVLTVGRATGREPRAEEYASSLRHRLDAVGAATANAPKKRVMTLEWLDPPMPGGHWVPQMVEIAGGASAPILPGEPSRKIRWNEMAAFEPEVVVLMPCGFDQHRAMREADTLGRLPGWLDLPAVRSGEVYAVDANHRFSRPAPGLVDGVEILAHILHPDAWPASPPTGEVLKLDSPSGASGWQPNFSPIS